MADQKFLPAPKDYFLGYDPGIGTSVGMTQTWEKRGDLWWYEARINGGPMEGKLIDSGFRDRLPFQLVNLEREL